MNLPARTCSISQHAAGGALSAVAASGRLLLAEPTTTFVPFPRQVGTDGNAPSFRAREGSIHERFVQPQLAIAQATSASSLRACPSRPLSAYCCKRQWQVSNAGYSFGNSCHCAPAPSTLRNSIQHCTRVLVRPTATSEERDALLNFPCSAQYFLAFKPPDGRRHLAYKGHVAHLSDANEQSIIRSSGHVVPNAAQKKGCILHTATHSTTRMQWQLPKECRRSQRAGRAAP